MNGRDVVRLGLLSAPRRPIVTKHAHRTSGVPLRVNCSCATRSSCVDRFSPLEECVAVCRFGIGYSQWETGSEILSDARFRNCYSVDTASWPMAVQFKLQDRRKCCRFIPASRDGNPESHVPVARCAGECQSVNAHPLASPRIPAVLALEVQTHGTTTPAKGPTTPDPRDGCGERHLGRGTHCQRTEAEARNPGLTPHRGELSARRRSGAHARSQAALADLHPQPCQGHCGL